MTLLELIAALEAAEGPSLELDRQISIAMSRITYNLPCTASIDAALTLVPQGYDWDVGHIHKNGFVCASIMWEAMAGEDFAEFLDAGPETIIWWNETGKAATPALALCIAALKTRAAIAPAAPAEPLPPEV